MRTWITYSCDTPVSAERDGDFRERGAAVRRAHSRIVRNREKRTARTCCRVTLHLRYARRAPVNSRGVFAIYNKRARSRLRAAARRTWSVKRKLETWHWALHELQPGLFNKIASVGEEATLRERGERRGSRSAAFEISNVALFRFCQRGTRFR